MTMPSVDCPTPYTQHSATKSIVLDRFNQRVQGLRQHSNRCQNQYQMSQQTLRTNEKRNTNLLRQRLQENKLKKGSKCKMDAPRNKVPPVLDDGEYAMVRQPTKRKLPECGAGLGYVEPHTQQQEAKRMKPDGQNTNIDQPEFSQLSVQIVAKYGNPGDQIKVNVQSNRSGSDQDSVSVKVKQENGRRQNNTNRHQEPVPEMGDESSFGNVQDSDVLQEFDDFFDMLTKQVSQSQPPSYPNNTFSSQNTFQSPQQYVNTTSEHATQRPPMFHQDAASTTPMQHPQMGRTCKSEKEEMFHMFRGNTPENKPDAAAQFNSHFAASISSQQNVSVNMMSQQQDNYPPTMTRQLSNHSNMTSQHIHRLSQVVQFPTSPPQEPPPLFHPPTNRQNLQYESSAQLRHIAEKNRNERIRPPSSLPHYHNEGQPVNVMSHSMSGVSQRLSHMDGAVYSRAQFMHTQQRSEMMMQQSVHQDTMMMRQYPLRQNQPAAYNRVPEPQHVAPNYHANGQHVWSNARWQQMASHHAMQQHRPQVTPMQRPHMNPNVGSSDLPELDNNDLKFIDEIIQ